MLTLVQLSMAGWDYILDDASVPRHWDHCCHCQSRNLTIKKAPMVRTSDSSGLSSLEKGGTCIGLGQTERLVCAINELPSEAFDLELPEVNRSLDTSCLRGLPARIKCCQSSPRGDGDLRSNVRTTGVHTDGRPGLWAKLGSASAPRSASYLSSSRAHLQWWV